MKPPRSVRPETAALARRRARAAASLTAATGSSAEEQVALLKPLCRHLWALLDRRRDDGVSTERLFERLTTEARAAVDQTFEAALTLWARDRIHVEPCRRITDRQRGGPYLFTLVPLHGETRVVDEETLLAMAGVRQ